MAQPVSTPAPVRLTSLSHGAGCACKLGSAELAEVLRHLPAVDDASVLVDAATRDDAAVYRIAPDRALVATLDFFTPILDDPASWGAVAAANALSDVYAMGGRPLFALNIVAWPRDTLPFELLGRVLAGASDVARRGPEAGEESRQLRCPVPRAPRLRSDLYGFFGVLYGTSLWTGFQTTW